MDFAEKMKREDRLLANLVRWMETHGEVLSDQSRSNYYTEVRIRTIRWRGRVYTAVDVDGLTCQLEREPDSETTDRL